MKSKIFPDSEWHVRFAEWQQLARNVRDRAIALDKSTHDRGWALAKSVGIPRCGCSLHNAAIDDEMIGWCAGNPHRLKVAKQANHLLSLWHASNLADRIIARAWQKLLS